MAGRVSTPLEEIRTLDPLADHQRIVYLIYGHDFTFDMLQSTGLAMLRTFCSPRISALLRANGEFIDRARKRYDDTDILLSTLVERGYDSAEGRVALQRINEIHGAFRISNEDYQYVLSTFIYEPIKWNGLYGWRPMARAEHLALFYFWRAIGERMHIADLPATYEEFEQFQRAYEQANFRFTPANHQLSEAIRLLLAEVLPMPLRRLAAAAFPAVMDDAMRTALGYPTLPPWKIRLVRSLLQARARCAALLPAKRRPSERTTGAFASYPRGYNLAEVGPAQPQSIPGS